MLATIVVVNFTGISDYNFRVIQCYRCFPHTWSSSVPGVYGLAALDQRSVRVQHLEGAVYFGPIRLQSNVCDKLDFWRNSFIQQLASVPTRFQDSLASMWLLNRLLILAAGSSFTSYRIQWSKAAAVVSLLREFSTCARTSYSTTRSGYIHLNKVTIH